MKKLKILLMGEFSGLHWTLAEGLRQLGHHVDVLSDGDGWKNFPRNISLTRPHNNALDGIIYILRLLSVLPRLRGYDVVQVVHPSFLKLRPDKCLRVYHYLSKHNKEMFLGAFGNDYYWVKTCVETDTFRYSDFKIGNTPRDTPTNRRIINECLHGATSHANQTIARECKGIISCLYEYYASYKPYFPQKMVFIPLPIDLTNIRPRIRGTDDKINFFIGIQADRSDVKGTDIMLPALEELVSRYPDRCRMTKVVSLPQDQYQQALDTADVQLDQIYSYTPSVNSLMAMARGIVVVGGGEEENYRLLGEQHLRPIVNVQPNKEDIYHKLEQLVLNPGMIPELSRQSIEYVSRYHNHIEIARQYVAFWKKSLTFVQTNNL